MPTFLAGLVIFFGLAFSIDAFHETFHAYETSDWRSTTGRIISAKERYSQVSDGTDACELEVAYEYTTHHFARDGRVTELTHAGSVLRKCRNTYQEGQIVEVFYDPGQTYRSDLESGAYFGSLFDWIIGLVLISLGVGIYRSQ